MKKSELIEKAIEQITIGLESVELDDKAGEEKLLQSLKNIKFKYGMSFSSFELKQWKYHLERFHNVELVIEKRPYGLICLVLDIFSDKSYGTASGQWMPDLLLNVESTINERQG